MFHNDQQAPNDQQTPQAGPHNAMLRAISDAADHARSDGDHATAMQLLLILELSRTGFNRAPGDP
jgi:hypothetical protein